MIALRWPHIEPHLITRSLVPENQESPIHFFSLAAVTPEGFFYIRNHFSYPMLSEESFAVTIDGEVRNSLTFHYRDLLSMPSKEIAVTLECSGNKRARFKLKVYGIQWEEGAISQGVWKGVPLRDLLNYAGLKPTAREVVFAGRDCGTRTDMAGTYPYARSLPLDKALHPDTLVAYELNGQPIPYKHGYPLRLIVPQWYGMASVKWLRSITVLDARFTGPFQVVDYVYEPGTDSDDGKSPVTLVHVNSTIQFPMDRSLLDTGTIQICGIAWTGTGFITDVELSLNGGESWVSADVHRLPNQPYAWILWTYRWDVSQQGEYAILCRARDSYGNIQPAAASWNKKGYGYNAISSINVKVE
ncbi:sulfite oxidase [Paenibacillus profundus]|uniref:sulfite oxidase n=1 Tax=Paenibacillus profundus TaxID=1173085 RepID=UPI002D7FF230|nr:sulfite oxidase [Paenibacillus profundus]